MLTATVPIKVLTSGVARSNLVQPRVQAKCCGRSLFGSVATLFPSMNATSTKAEVCFPLTLLILSRIARFFTLSNVYTCYIQMLLYSKHTLSVQRELDKWVCVRNIRPRSLAFLGRPNFGCEARDWSVLSHLFDYNHHASHTQE